MKLYGSTRSPFARKVAIVLHELDIQDQVTHMTTNLALPKVPTPDILEMNPLGKIPTFVLDDGRTLFDSRVICEYLNTTYRGSLFGHSDSERQQHLLWQALGDGLNDALLLWRTELNRADQKSDAICANLETKVCATMSHLEDIIDQLSETPFGIGHIALICALGQLNFRWSESNWQQHFPNLSSWYQDVANRPSINATPNAIEDSTTAFPIKAPQIKFNKV